MSLKVRIITPTGVLFDGTAEEAVLPGIEGHIGVRAGHRLLITALKEGAVRVKRGDGEETFDIRGGFADIGPDAVTVTVR